MASNAFAFFDYYILQMVMQCDRSWTLSEFELF